MAKYLALAALATAKIHAAWIDLDVFVVSDPKSLVLAELSGSSELVFARHSLWVTQKNGQRERRATNARLGSM